MKKQLVLMLKKVLQSGQKSNYSENHDIIINKFAKLTKISKSQFGCILKPIIKAKKRENFRQK